MSILQEEKSSTVRLTAAVFFYAAVSHHVRIEYAAAGVNEKWRM
ncbi:hypothetical protein CHCC20347_0591 [Bacillus paralicheniformis]|nr:hypothetical protein CHCC20347_0591 [Bacillus paralicheniformis]